MSMDSADTVRRHLLELARNAESAAERIPDLATRYAELVRETLLGGGKLMYAGNGGSAAAAEHIATEYVVRLKRDRRALPAMALTASTSTMSAAANDLGYDQIFARLVEAHGQPGDLLVLHSTSGNSANLLEAARVAARIGVTTVALLDRSGGQLASLVDLAIRVPADGSASVQELQLAVEHAVADLVDDWFARDPEDDR
ncbi:MAG: SIS domain-containing protein [Gemmatimonadetes bacterium]|nr:SIS domain-containing protein [Gemmatimonadota bacterium]NNK48516.1 SIS domain-containing protein [Gemmatimonadota bacterium]